MPRARVLHGSAAPAGGRRRISSDHHPFDQPVITQHDTELDHALKEVDAAARATARTPEQVAAVLRYVITGELG